MAQNYLNLNKKEKKKKRSNNNKVAKELACQGHTMISDGSIFIYPHFTCEKRYFHGYNTWITIHTLILSTKSLYVYLGNQCYIKL